MKNYYILRLSFKKCVILACIKRNNLFYLINKNYIQVDLRFIDKCVLRRIHPNHAGTNETVFVVWPNNDHFYLLFLCRFCLCNILKFYIILVTWFCMENCDTAKIQIKGQITCMASMIPLLKGEVVGRLKKAVIDSMQLGPLSTGRWPRNIWP